VSEDRDVDRATLAAERAADALEVIADGLVDQLRWRRALVRILADACTIEEADEMVRDALGPEEAKRLLGELAREREAE